MFHHYRTMYKICVKIYFVKRSHLIIVQVLPSNECYIITKLLSTTCLLVVINVNPTWYMIHVYQHNNTREDPLVLQIPISEYCQGSWRCLQRTEDWSVRLFWDQKENGSKQRHKWPPFVSCEHALRLSTTVI